MDIFHLVEGQPPRRLEKPGRLPDDGIVWIDYERPRAHGWECWLEPLVGVAIEPQHVSDSLNPSHPSFFDGTSDYDMLIFEGLGPRDTPFPLETRTAAFFLFERVLVTVRAEDSLSFRAVKQRVAEGRIRMTHVSVLRLAHQILDTMIDRFLKIREPLDRELTRLQDELLDVTNPMDDWRGLLEGRRVARQLETLCENQLEALDAWRRGSRFEWSEHDEIEIRDLVEHVNRVLDHASGQERDVEAAVQLHFASASHRMNRIMRTLTIFSAIFLPLTFIAGIYGMNFAHMPELGWIYGYPTALGSMTLVAVVLLIIFKRRGYF